MINVVCFSGGKDSTALLLWARENLPDFTAVFCDTGWEHPITYAYVEEINGTVLGGKLVTLKSQKYASGFVSLCELKGRVPSVKARFCTDALKVRPMIEWLKKLDDDVTVFQGIRADESHSRSKMPAREWSDDYDAWIERPLLAWSAAQCFELMAERGVKPNPLYLMGARRVGCFPCVMVNQRELKAFLAGPLGAELRSRVLDLEARVGSSFFASGTIPDRFCTLSEMVDCRICHKTGKVWISGPENGLGERGTCSRCKGAGEYRAYVPTASDVFRYIESVDEDQLPLFPARACMSVYNLCE